MSTQNSEQLVKATAPERTALSPNETGGRVRQAYWSFNTTDDINAALAENDIIRLVKIPAGARILQGNIQFEAMGTDQTVQMGIQGADGSGTYNDAGTADSVTFFEASIDISSAGESVFAQDATGNRFYVTEKEVYLTAKLVDTSSSDPWDADKDFDGVAWYVIGS